MILLPYRHDRMVVQRFPVVSAVLAAGCVVGTLAWLQALGAGELETFYATWGVSPAGFTWGRAVRSMFAHAGPMHLIGNLLFLYLTAPMLEDRWGRVPFAIFYAVCGLGAVWAMSWAFPHSSTPMVGASGAVAGCMGAFLVAHPGARIRFFYLLFWPILWIRGKGAGTFAAAAWVMLPLWLAGELFSALMWQEFGGVAYWAHVGGFATGAAVGLGLRVTGLGSKLGDLESDLPRNGLKRLTELALDGEWERALKVRERGVDGVPPMLELKLTEAALRAGRRDLAMTCFERARDPLTRHGTGSTVSRLVGLGERLEPFDERDWLLGLQSHSAAEVRIAVDRRLGMLGWSDAPAPRLAPQGGSPSLERVPAPQRRPRGASSRSPAWAGAPSWEQPHPTPQSLAGAESPSGPAPGRTFLRATSESIWSPPPSQPPTREPWSSQDSLPPAPWDAEGS